MKFILTVILNALFLISSSQTSEISQIKETFNKYKSAILNDNADDALVTVDSRTTKYYTDILNDIKNGDSLRINSLSLVDKITILGIRAKAEKSEIVAMKGTDAFIYAVKNGMVGKNSVVNNSIGKITIDKTFAKGELIKNDQPTNLFFHFYKENGKWKIDLTSLFPLSNFALKKMIEESGKDENELLLQILEAMAHKKIGSDIWNPVH